MAKDRRCLDDQSWEVAAMASAETVMAVYSDREDKGLESRMRSKDSCPVWGEGAGKVPDGNSPTPYSTAYRVIEAVESAQALTRRAASGDAGLVRLGFTAASAYQTLPRLVASVRASMPDIDLVLEE